MSNKALIPYPGGKSNNKEIILDKLVSMIGYKSTEYRETCFGGGSIGSALLQKSSCVNSMWINDIDMALAALWNDVIQDSSSLKKKIRNFVPCKAAFDRIKTELLNKPATQIMDAGFKKLVCHRMSHSGYGTKGGARKDILSRWNPSRLCDEIDRLNQILNSIDIRNHRCTSVDLIDVIKEKSSLNCVIYLDPPIL